MKNLIPIIAGITLCAFLTESTQAQNTPTSVLAASILKDSQLDTVQGRALQLLTGLSAGTSYGEVWIRDFNTFINGSLQVLPRDTIKEMLLLFFKMQGNDGNISDGVIKKEKANVGYQYRYSDLAPEWAAHKNTVETDQESSLIQAVNKYVVATGDRSLLFLALSDKTILQRMEWALEYLLKDRWSSKYGLITGATTVDWGDVQPETGWGVAINEKTKWAIDIYDNAMFVIAIQDFLSMKPADYQTTRNWKQVAAGIRKNVRKYLWDPAAQKYIPHLYLNDSPFSPSFNEKEILYTGGSACAVLAGFHSKAEIAIINKQMIQAASKEKFATIGITVYPPYPAQEYPNMHPYVYQNAGDWTWFGGRMIQALIKNGFITEAVDELKPMTDRVIAHQGFFEWYDVKTGTPKGSGNFRGEAGVLLDAITLLKKWAVNNRK
ncbi:GH36-type glycosyl hydrolase domain-containing protein [Chitinophaga sp.]|uniref:GH36-type glycosyl hydrolase domain-containing protein n=1 Tax=Chitinophaga sp. TaxID=1869181 RepID=UPI002F94911B